MTFLPGRDRKRFLPALSAPDIAAIDKSSAIVVLPLGAIEQHGPHLPVYVDCMTVEAVLEGAIDQVGERLNVWTLPVQAYAKSNEHIHFTGTITLSAETLSRLLRELGSSLARAGFRKLLIVNGHGGNVPTLEFTARDIRIETGLMVFITGTGLRAGLPAGSLEPSEERWGLHAGDLETSAVMAIAPHLVHVDRIAGSAPAFLDDFALVGPTKGTVTVAWLTEDLAANGVIGNPRTATAEKGRLAIAGGARQLAQALEEISRFAFPVSAPVEGDGRLTQADGGESAHMKKRGSPTRM